MKIRHISDNVLIDQGIRLIGRYTTNANTWWRDDDDSDYYSDHFDWYGCDWDFDSNGFCIPYLTDSEKREKTIDIIFGDDIGVDFSNSLENYWPD